MSKLQRKIYDNYSRTLNILPQMANEDYRALRRAAMTLHRWYEHECNGVIQRDEETNKPYWYNANTGKRISSAADREKGAEKTIMKICTRLGLHYYLQTDPRGGTLYVSKDFIDQADYNRATFIA